MSSDNIAIQVSNLSKCYFIYDRSQDRLKQYIYPRLQRLMGRQPKNHFREFWALKDISFEVKKGETVGIIGRNGSGKSTLLQIICGTLTPTSGTVETKGRIAALLELGSGFNPEFTGRENVYMNGAVLGLSKEEINARFHDIAAFADIGEFIDQPVKMYSSGMAVRLAFAVSASIDPDILVVDEALAVGDIRFQAKCFNRLKKLKESGTAILFVSHMTDQIVKHCDKAVLMESGLIVNVGLPKNITNKYMDLLYGRQHLTGSGTSADVSREQGDIIVVNHSAGISEYFSATIHEQYTQTLGWNPDEYKWGNGDAAILDFRVLDKAGNHNIQLYSGEDYLIAMKVLLKKKVANVVFGFYIKTIDGLFITGSNSRDYPDEQQKPWTISQDNELFEVYFSFSARLASGEYMISLGVAEDVSGELVPLARRYDSILVHVVCRNPYFGLVDLGSRCLVKELRPTRG